MKTLYERWKEIMEPVVDDVHKLYDEKKSQLVSALEVTEQEMENPFFEAAFDKLKEGCVIQVSVIKSIQCMRLFRDCTDEEFAGFMQDWQKNETSLDKEFVLLSICKMREGLTMK